MMNSGDTKQAMEVYERALGLPERRRHDFIMRELANDSAAQQFCIAMLDADVAPADAAIQSLLAPAVIPERPLPEVFHRYRIQGDFPGTKYFDFYLGIADGEKEPVVIKAMREDSINHDAAQVMLREIDARAWIWEHGWADANIVPIHHVGEWEGRPYVTMPIIRGWHVNEFAEIPEGQAVWSRVFAFLTLCYALRSIHGASVVHCDLSHRNVLIDHKGFAHILDFGSAYIPGRPWPPRRATEHYVAPERQDRHAVPHAAWDIYAAGMLGRELLSFECARDEKLDAILSKAYAAEQADRYQNIMELEEEVFAYASRKGFGRRGWRRLPSDLLVRKPPWRQRIRETAIECVVGPFIVARAFYRLFKFMYQSISAREDSGDAKDSSGR